MSSSFFEIYTLTLIGGDAYCEQHFIIIWQGYVNINYGNLDRCNVVYDISNHNYFKF